MLSNERIREIAAAMKSFNVDSMLTWYSRLLDVFADVDESYPVLQKTSLQFYAYTFQHLRRQGCGWYFYSHASPERVMKSRIEPPNSAYLNQS
jgi:hypothetical protein